MRCGRGSFTVELDALADLAEQVRPRLITVGTSLNLLPHPVAEIRQIADIVGAGAVRRCARVRDDRRQWLAEPALAGRRP